MEIIEKLKNDSELLEQLDKELKTKISENSALQTRNKQLQMKITSLEEKYEKTLRENQKLSIFQESAVAKLIQEGQSLEIILRSYSEILLNENSITKKDFEDLRSKIQKLELELKELASERDELKNYSELLVNNLNDLKSYVETKMDTLLKNSKEEKNKKKILDLEIELEKAAEEKKQLEKQFEEEISKLKDTINQKDLKYSLLEMDLKDCLKINPNN